MAGEWGEGLFVWGFAGPEEAGLQLPAERSASPPSPFLAQLASLTPCLCLGDN